MGFRMKSLLILLGISTALIGAQTVKPSPEHLNSMSKYARHIRNNPQRAHDCTFLISFPRSSQHWMKSCIEILSGIPIYSLYDGYELQNPLNVPLDHRKKPCFVTHFPDWVEGAPTNKNRLFVVVRNYKECIIRRAISFGRSFDFNKDRSSFDLYAQILQYYDAWDPDHRLLLYYEDIITHPEEEMRKLSVFLKGSQERYEDFVTNYNVYQKRSCNYYEQLQKERGGSMTRGKSPIYHSAKLSPQKLKRFDQEIQNRLGSELFNKYLSRYTSS